MKNKTTLSKINENTYKEKKLLRNKSKQIKTNRKSKEAVIKQKN